MEALPFKPGPQIAGTEVIDIYGIHWTVLKDISNALAQPREGAYYTRVIDAVPEVIDINAQLHEDDFYFETQTINGELINKLRIKR